MPPIVYEPSRKRLVQYFSGTVAFTLLCAVVPFVLPHSAKALLAGVVGVPFMGLFALFYGSRLVRRGPELTITDDGFEHRLWGWVAWDEVELVTTRAQRAKGRGSMFVQREYMFVQVVLKDSNRTFARLRPSGRIFALMNRSWGRHVFISANVLSVSFEEVLAAMQQAHQRHLGIDPVAS